MINRNIKISASFISIIYLPLALLLAMIEMINGARWSVYVCSFMLGVLAFLLIPYENWDLTRHYETYLYVSQTSLNKVFENSDNRYITINTVIYLFKSLGIKKEFLPFFSTFLSYIFILIYMLITLKNTIRNYLIDVYIYIF